MLGGGPAILNKLHRGACAGIKTARMSLRSLNQVRIISTIICSHESSLLHHRAGAWRQSAACRAFADLTSLAETVAELYHMLVWH